MEEEKREKKMYREKRERQGERKYENNKKDFRFFLSLSFFLREEVIYLCYAGADAMM